MLTATARVPLVARQYNAQITAEGCHKKITFKNPWSISRRFAISTSNERVMKSRDAMVDVSGNGTAVIRLWFAKARFSIDSEEVYLFLNDTSGDGEECFQFNLTF